MRVDHWPLIGRADEIEVVLDTVRKRASSVVLTGAAGVGKSRLQRELLDILAADGFTIRRSIATGAASAISFGALIPLLADASGDPTDRVRLTQRLLAELTADTEKGVVAVDDAHLLDALSAAVIHQLAVQSDVRLILTIRTGESAPDAITSLVKDAYTQRFELQPLSRGESDHLVTTVLGGTVAAHALGRLWDVTAGNPFYLREVVLGALESGDLRSAGNVWTWSGAPVVSALLRDAVTARLGMLEREEQRALEILALGEPLAIDRLEAASGDEIVAQLERKGLVTETPQGARRLARFVHPMYGEIVRAIAAPRDIDAARTALVELYERFDPVDGDETLRAAVLHLDAGRFDRPELLMEGARLASQSADFVLAERLAAQAFAVAPGPLSAARLAGPLVELGRYSEVVSLVEPFLDEKTWDEVHYELASCSGTSLWVGLDDAEAADELWSKGVDRAANEVIGQRFLAIRATVRGNVGDSEEVIATALAGLDDPAVDPIAGGFSLIMAGVLLAASGRPVDSEALFERFLGSFENMVELIGHQPGGQEIIAARLLPAAYKGDPSDLIPVIQEIHEHAVRSADEVVRMISATSLAGMFLWTGRPRSACRYAAECLDIAAPRGRLGRTDWVAAMYAESLALLGDVQGAKRLLQRARELRSRAPRFHHPEITRAEAWVLAASGEHSAARRCALGAAEFAREHGWTTYELFALHDAVRLGATEHASAVARLAGTVQGDSVAAIKLHVSGIVDSDPDLLDEASTALEGAGRNLLAAEAAAQAAAAYDKAALRARAAAAGERARMLAARCDGAVTVILSTGQRPDPLTRREREVATLASRGRSNRAIADDLGTSVRTVEGHLYQAYAKLGVSTRTELTDALRPTEASQAT